MKRLAAVIAVFSFFAMISLDSSACYLKMLTKGPAADCVGQDRTSPPDCQVSCGLPNRQRRANCNPDNPPLHVVCMIGFSSDTSLRPFCGCGLTPPLTSILLKRRTLDDASSADLPVAYRIQSSRPDHKSFIRDSRPQGVYLTIPTTVLRC